MLFDAELGSEQLPPPLPVRFGSAARIRWAGGATVMAHVCKCAQPGG